MFTLALPVVLAELGWMAMGLVDTLMVGRLGAEAIGAVGIGTSLFMGVTIFAIGLMLGWTRSSPRRGGRGAWTNAIAGWCMASCSPPS
jgi:multidrug resistance protein, MATE family